MLVDWLINIVPSSWMPRVLVFSVILNLVLGVALFFRSAINGIIVHAYTARRERKQTQQQILRDLHAKMDAFARDYFLALVTSGMVSNATTEEEQRTFAEKQEEMLPKVEAAHAFLAQHELEFPHNVRSLIDQLRKEMVLPSMESVGSKDVIMERSDAVNRVVREIKAAVSRHVK